METTTDSRRKSAQSKQNAYTEHFVKFFIPNPDEKGYAVNQLFISLLEETPHNHDRPKTMLRLKTMQDNVEKSFVLFNKKLQRMTNPSIPTIAGEMVKEHSPESEFSKHLHTYYSALPGRNLTVKEVKWEFEHWISHLKRTRAKISEMKVLKK